MPSTEKTIEPVWIGSAPDWTPRGARYAYENCQGGELSDAAILCDALMTDARIRGVLETRKNALFGCELEFEARGHKARSNPVIRALKDDGEFWAMAPETALGQIFTWGLLLNVGLGELTWQHTKSLASSAEVDVVQRDSKWSQILTPKHPRNLREDPLTRTWRLTVASGKETEITPGDGQWLMFCPFGENKPYQRGLYFDLALLWLSKTYSDFDWGRRNEARGRAAMIGTTPDGANDEDRTKFSKSLAELRRKLAIAIPAGYKVEAVEFGQDDHETFKARIDWADGAIATLVLGQNLGGDNARASNIAAPKTNDKVRQDYLENDAETFATCIQAHALRPYTNVRFANADLAPWPKWKTEPPEDIVQSADTTKKAAEALDKLLGRGVPVDHVAFCERFKIPLVAGAPIVPPAPPPTSAPPKSDEEKSTDAP